MLWRRGSTTNVCRVSDEEDGRSHSSVLWHENVRHKDTRRHIPLRLAIVMSLVRVAQADQTLLDGFMIIPSWELQSSPPKPSTVKSCRWKLCLIITVAPASPCLPIYAISALDKKLHTSCSASSPSSAFTDVTGG